MNLSKPKNPNYAATVVAIKTLVQLENCDNVQAAIILGNQVIVSKEVKIGDVGIYFPLECQLSPVYLAQNNLYSRKELNRDNTQRGYFDVNGRIRCQKFRGHKSEGLFMPIASISEFLDEQDNLYIGDEFDTLNGNLICSKYVVKTRTYNPSTDKKSKKYRKLESKVIDNQFRFHDDTSMLYKNLHKINPNDLISITYKLHGTSGISSYVLCKKKLNIVEKLLLKLGVNIQTEVYDYIYSSRKVVKNPELNPNAQHYYKEDIWRIAHRELEAFLQKGMTFYYEIVGYLPNGACIQKDYDYGCEVGNFKIYIYRITQTNVDGKVTEYSAKQVQDFCKKNGLNAVPELYYGKASNFYDVKILGRKKSFDFEEKWRINFLEQVKKAYNEKECYMCSNKVPEEGCVIRLEKLQFEAYKAKSNAFYERETILLDKGESNIEEEN